MSEATRERDEYTEELLEDNAQLEAEMCRLSDGIMKLARRFKEHGMHGEADLLCQLAGRKVND